MPSCFWNFWPRLYITFSAKLSGLLYRCEELGVILTNGFQDAGGGLQDAGVGRVLLLFCNVSNTAARYVSTLLGQPCYSFLAADKNVLLVCGLWAKCDGDRLMEIAFRWRKCLYFESCMWLLVAIE